MERGSFVVDADKLAIFFQTNPILPVFALAKAVIFNKSIPVDVDLSCFGVKISLKVSSIALR